MWRHPIFPSFGNHQISGLHTYNDDDDDDNDNDTLQYYWIRLSMLSAENDHDSLRELILVRDQL